MCSKFSPSPLDFRHGGQMTVYVPGLMLTTCFFVIVFLLFVWSTAFWFCKIKYIKIYCWEESEHKILYSLYLPRVKLLRFCWGRKYEPGQGFFLLVFFTCLSFKNHYFTDFTIFYSRYTLYLSILCILIRGSVCSVVSQFLADAFYGTHNRRKATLRNVCFELKHKHEGYDRTWNSVISKTLGLKRKKVNVASTW